MPTYKYTFLTDTPEVYLEQEIVTDLTLPEVAATERYNPVILTIEEVVRSPEHYNAIPMWRSSNKDYNKA